MNCTREEHVQHLAGEVRAIGEEKVEVRSVGAVIQPHASAAHPALQLYAPERNHLPAIGRAKKAEPTRIRRIRAPKLPGWFAR